MTDYQVVAEWKAVNETEKVIAQSYVSELTGILSAPTSLVTYPEGKNYAFEGHSNRAAHGKGFANGWKCRQCCSLRSANTKPGVGRWA